MIKNDVVSFQSVRNVFQKLKPSKVTMMDEQEFNDETLSYDYFVGVTAINRMINKLMHAR